MLSEPRSLICLFESFESRVARDRQRLNEGPLAVFRRENFDAPGPIEVHFAHARMKPTTSWAPWPMRVRRSRVSSNRVPIDSSWASLSSTPKTMFESRHSTSSGSVVSARKTCQKSTSNPADGWPAARSGQRLGASSRSNRRGAVRSQRGFRPPPLRWRSGGAG